MSIVSVQPKSFILALFIRDDGERFLLGDNGYEFKDSQLHFAANTIENDEVQKQGADGVMIAGQVRRASVQSFDGYVGDATMAKETIEQMRRDFIAFFLKGHHYRVIYVDCNRNAWQRKGGYLVDAPEVKELWQIHPEYHVGLNFEDVNYYSYDEDADGNEILANLMNVPVSTEIEGGLVWDEDGAVSEDAGDISYDEETADATPAKNVYITDATEAPIASFELDGETSQNGTPTPDAPVAVQTVTGENVVKICGKNLFDNQYYKDNKSKFVISYQAYFYAIELGDEFKKQITVSMSLSGTAQTNLALALTDSIGSAPSADVRVLTTNGTITTRSYDFRNSAHVYLQIGATTQQTALNTGIDAIMDNYNIQCELGSATAYEPYQGQSFTLSLGSLELCKIGDYQDYIYKSGGKWYVHKAVGKVVFDGSESWNDFSTDASKRYYTGEYSSLISGLPQTTVALSDYFVFDGVESGTLTNGKFFFNMSAGTTVANGNITINNNDLASVSACKTWLQSNNVRIYYQLSTPTDTEITNEALIEQLDNVASAPLYTGVNNITTITPNEQGTLEISYYTKYQPMVGSGGYVWEAGGAGGPTVIMNNSIDSVSPVWTIYGPTTNPQLENATTGETIEYVGTIAQGQTLTIDMGEQAASLDGLNVISNLVGDFIQLAPGRNNIIYSVSGEAGASELGWSEIVG